MSDVAIRVEGLSKKYHIGAIQKHKTIRDLVSDSLAAPFKRIGRLARGHSGAAMNLEEDFWALNNISFEVKRGEVVGIIGRNGAGKSTLLKILSRITHPTQGHVELHGRVGSLLEVGTGFHPELTGRENVYLNGAILGMKRAEIERKFDEIVAFSEVEKFIDTPVKHYSSGMYVRLAFAVAAHLEPEILIVDEVLAVGDVAFQKKCLGKIEGVAGEGRTVLFVSHNMRTIQTLCQRTLLLSEGQIAADRDTASVVEEYLMTTAKSIDNHRPLNLHPREKEYGKVTRFTRCTILNSEGTPTNQLLFGEPFSLCLEMTSDVAQDDMILTIGFDTLFEYRVATSMSRDSQCFFSVTPEKPLQVSARFDDLTLVPGDYQLEISIVAKGIVWDRLLHFASIQVVEAAYETHSPYSGAWGIVFTQPDWRVESD